MANVKRISRITPEAVKQARGSHSQHVAAHAAGVSLSQYQYYEAGTTAMKESDYNHMVKNLTELLNRT